MRNKKNEARVPQELLDRVIEEHNNDIKNGTHTPCCDENNPCCCNTFSPTMVSPADVDEFKKRLKDNMLSSPPRIVFSDDLEIKMISKSEMVDGAYYNGICRNTRVALWDEKENVFIHLSYSFHYYMDKIEHFEDVKHKSIDGFIPIEQVEPIHHEIISKIKNEIGY